MTEVIVEKKDAKREEEFSELERRLLYLLKNSESLSKEYPRDYFIILNKVFKNYFSHPRHQGEIRQYEEAKGVLVRT